MIALSILCTLLLGTSIYFFIPYWKREKAIAEHRKEYLSAETKLEPCYTDILGNRWYQFKSSLDMPPLRSIRCEVATRMANLGLTEKMFDDYTDQIKKALNRGDVSRAGYLVNRMEERRTLAAEEETLRQMCDSYFLIEGENPKECSDYWFQKKIEAWEKDPAAYAFFLHECLKYIRSIEGLSNTGLLQFLRNQAVEKALHRL
jgi:hypothetical protein